MCSGWSYGASPLRLQVSSRRRPHIIHWYSDTLVSFGRDVGGQGEVETCSARRVAGSPQATAMRFNDGAADGQSHAGPLDLGCKEGIEDLVLLRGQPHASIADGHKKMLA